MIKKNLIKFFITVSILLTTFNSNTLAENAIGGEKLQKLLTENHIIINYFTCPLRNNVELNFDAGRKTYERDGFFQCRDGDIPDKNFIHPTSGTWELVDAEKDVVQLNDIQNKYTNQVTRIQLLFGDNGNISNLNYKLYSYRLENKKQRIENNARRIEAEELKLKKIEEEKRQLAIKREQEKIRAEQLKIKQDDEKRRLEEEKEIIRKKEVEEKAKLKREKFWKDTFFFIIVSAFIVGSYYYINRFHKEKIVIYKNQIIKKLKNIWSYKWGKNKFVMGALILFGVLILYNLFSKNNDNYSKNNNPEENLRINAARAVDAASACYRSLPSHAQSGTVSNMLDARKYYNDGVKFLNMDQTYSSMAPFYFNNAISYSNIVMQIGRAYGSRSCG